MNNFRQHIPNFVEGTNPAAFDFETTDELLASEVIQRYIPLYNKECSFCMSGNHLMVLTHNGFRWMVVGYIQNRDDIELPDWDGGKYLTIDSTNHYVELTSEDVNSTCGDIATLNDGTTVEFIRF
jgi:hypothetical protein